jgi:hypothetical protein
MKRELAVVLLLILASSFKLQEAHEHGAHGKPHSFKKYPPLTNKFTLEFDHASREGVPQTSNKFVVQFNGKKLKEFLPTDYNIHHEVFKVTSCVGKNSLHFIGTGTSDSLGHTIDNVKLHRTSFCGYQDVIVNGGFEEGHTLGNTWAIFPNGKIPGWTSKDN